MEYSKAIHKLQEDHDVMENLFHQFEEADSSVRQHVVEEALLKLEIHSNLEEDLIYPAIRDVIPEKDMIDEAIEEHHVVSLLARELRKMQATDDRYKAKFRVLMRIVRNHVKEEEARIFPEAEKSGLDWMGLSQQAAVLRDRLVKRAKRKFSKLRT